MSALTLLNHDRTFGTTNRLWVHFILVPAVSSIPPGDRPAWEGIDVWLEYRPTSASHCIIKYPMPPFCLWGGSHGVLHKLAWPLIPIFMVFVLCYLLSSSMWRSANVGHHEMGLNIFGLTSLGARWGRKKLNYMIWWTRKCGSVTVSIASAVVIRGNIANRITTRAFRTKAGL